MARLKEKYNKEIISKVQKEFGYKNVMQVPKLSKIVINLGLGEALKNAKVIDDAKEELRAICGQAPVVTKAKKDISAFKLRKGVSIGLKVTLRRERMFEFFDRLVNITLPRVRDFNGVSAKAFDGRGNYTLGIREQVIFPEISIDKIQRTTGMNIVFCTTAKTDKESKSLLTHLGMPFVKEKEKSKSPS